MASRFKYITGVIAFVLAICLSMGVHGQRVSTSGCPTCLSTISGASYSDSEAIAPRIKKVYPWWDSTGSFAVLGGKWWFHNGVQWVSLSPNDTGTVTEILTDSTLQGSPIRLCSSCRRQSARTYFGRTGTGCERCLCESK